MAEATATTVAETTVMMMKIAKICFILSHLYQLKFWDMPVCRVTTTLYWKLINKLRKNGKSFLYFIAMRCECYVQKYNYFKVLI